MTDHRTTSGAVDRPGLKPNAILVLRGIQELQEGASTDDEAA